VAKRSAAWGVLRRCHPDERSLAFQVTFAGWFGRRQSRTNPSRGVRSTKISTGSRSCSLHSQPHARDHDGVHPVDLSNDQLAPADRCGRHFMKSEIVCVVGGARLLAGANRGCTERPHTTSYEAPTEAGGRRTDAQAEGRGSSRRDGRSAWRRSTRRSARGSGAWCGTRRGPCRPCVSRSGTSP